MSFPKSSYTGFPFNEESAADEFPFNRRGSRDSNLQSTLSNIAQRHPEIAEHLTNFSQSSRPRNRPAADEFKARFRRPFDDNSRFPFGEDLDLDQYTKQFYNPEDFQNPTSPPKQDNNSKPEPTQQSSEVPKTPEKDVNSNLHQSNTTDLGQRQEPIDDRNQRSMSAPPVGENKKRFTSSIHIPVNNPTENMAQQNQNQHHDSKPNERIIPIQIEGRESPIIPKNTHIPQQNSAQSRPEQIFGQSPETFTQFMRPNEPFPRRGFQEDHFARQAFPEEHFSRQNIPANFQQRDHHPPKEDTTIPVQKEVPKPQQPQPEQESKAEPKSEPPKPLTPIEQIQMIQKDVSQLMEQVEQFSGKTKDKQYLYLDEMLTRNLLKLDDIDTQGQENIRASRKEAIKCIQQAISLLDNQVTANAANDGIKAIEDSQKMDTEESPEKVEATETNTENANVDQSTNIEPNQETRAVLVISEPQNTSNSNDKENASTPAAESSDSKKNKKEKKKEQ